MTRPQIGDRCLFTVMDEHGNNLYDTRGVVEDILALDSGEDLYVVECDEQEYLVPDRLVYPLDCICDERRQNVREHTLDCPAYDYDALDIREGLRVHKADE